MIVCSRGDTVEILIVAIDHELQKAKGSHEPRERAARKDELEALLRRAIAERTVQFIGEESHPNAVTIAKQLADAHSPRIPWKNIDMSDDQRKKAGIDEALRNRPCNTEMRGGKTFIIEHRIPEDETREEYFIEQAKRSAGDAQSILILCGDLHVEALKEKLERDGLHRVETDHSLVEKTWI